MSSGSTFRVAETGDTINAPFFDVEDDYTVKSDLWQTGSIALTPADFFYGVNQGRNVIQFCPGFTRHVERLARNNEALINELKSTDRFKRALQRFGSSGT